MIECTPVEGGESLSLSFIQRRETKTDCRAVASLHYSLGLPRVPVLMTPVHMLMMSCAQGSDVIWLKGIGAHAPKGISTSINAAAAVFSRG